MWGWICPMVFLLGLFLPGGGCTHVRATHYIAMYESSSIKLVWLNCVAKRAKLIYPKEGHLGRQSAFLFSYFRMTLMATVDNDSSLKSISITIIWRDKKKNWNLILEFSSFSREISHRLSNFRAKLRRLIRCGWNPDVRKITSGVYPVRGGRIRLRHHLHTLVAIPLQIIIITIIITQLLPVRPPERQDLPPRARVVNRNVRVWRPNSTPV